MASRTAAFPEKEKGYQHIWAFRGWEQAGMARHQVKAGQDQVTRVDPRGRQRTLDEAIAGNLEYARDSTRRESVDRGIDVEIGAVACSLPVVCGRMVLDGCVESDERQGLARSVAERTRNNILGGALSQGVCVCQCGGECSSSVSRVSCLCELTPVRLSGLGEE